LAGPKAQNRSPLLPVWSFLPAALLQEGVAMVDEDTKRVEVRLLPVIVDAKVGARRIDRFVQMVREVGGYVAFGAATGLFLLLRHHIVGVDEVFLPLGRAANEIVDHIGSALLVSATVICLYEWGAEAKHSADLAANLANVLQRHIDTILQASSRESLANALREIAGVRADEFAVHLRQLADALRDLSGDDWVATVYTEFVRSNLERLSTQAAGLANLSVSLRADRKARTEYRLVLLEPSDIADVMLEQAALNMGAGQYFALSDAYTWTKLSQFRRAQHGSLLKHEVKMKRIFVLGKPSDSDVGAAVVARLVYDHYAEAAKSDGNYELKLIDQEEYRTVAGTKLLASHHFGVFKPTDEHMPPLIFQAVEPRLSEIRLAGPAEADDVTAEFLALWQRLPALKERPADTAGEVALTGAELIRDHLMAYRIKQLGVNGLYRGVSRLETWRERALEQFHAAARDAIVKHSITVRRIFVAGTLAEACDAETMNILRLHAEASTRLGAGIYEWRLCIQDELPLTLREAVPFGLFSDDGAVDGQMVKEVAKGDDPFVFDSGPGIFRSLAGTFDTFWNAIDREQSLREILKEQADGIILRLPSDAASSESDGGVKGRPTSR
jgi:hypothetical protein